MRLSDAVMLGQGLVKFNPIIFLSDGCGCLSGAGYAAATGKREGDLYDILAKWPWLRQTFDTPTILFDGFHARDFPTDTGHGMITLFALYIQQGHNTLEQAVDWIRQNEPQEDEAPTCTEIQHDEAVCEVRR